MDPDPRAKLVDGDAVFRPATKRPTRGLRMLTGKGDNSNPLLCECSIGCHDRDRADGREEFRVADCTPFGQPLRNLVGHRRWRGEPFSATASLGIRLQNANRWRKNRTDARPEDPAFARLFSGGYLLSATYESVEG